MKKLIALFLILFCLTAIADDEDKPKQRAPTVTHVVRPPQGARVSNKVFFLFDCSTSMGKDDRFNTALREMNTALTGGVPLDDGMFSVAGFRTDWVDFHGNVFTQTFLQWPGVHEKGVPAGWAKLPSAIALRSANEYLNSQRCTGYTDIGPAIQSAFRACRTLEKVTIILLSDGNNTYPNFNGTPPSKVAALIRKLNKARVDQKKDRIRIFVFGLNAEQNTKMLSEIAKAGGGGYLTLDTICPTCRRDKGKLDVPEIQRYHRNEHEDEEEEEEEVPDVPDLR